MLVWFSTGEKLVTWDRDHQQDVRRWTVMQFWQITKVCCAKAQYLVNLWPSSLFIHFSLEDSFSSMGSTINKILMTAKNKSLHNLILTIRPIILLVSRHLLLYVSKTLKLSKTRAWEAGISFAQLFPTDLFLLPHLRPWVRASSLPSGPG